MHQTNLLRRIEPKDAPQVRRDYPQRRAGRQIVHRKLAGRERAFRRNAHEVIGLSVSARRSDDEAERLQDVGCGKVLHPRKGIAGARGLPLDFLVFLRDSRHEPLEQIRSAVRVVADPKQQNRAGAWRVVGSEHADQAIDDGGALSVLGGVEGEKKR